MPSAPVDAMSVEAVHDAMEVALKHCREGNGPYLLEMKTYRYRGHSMSDPAKYRTKEEVEEYKAQDPVQRVLNTILEKKYASEAQIEAINEKVNLIVDDSVKFSEESEFPTADELYKDVYVQEDYPFLKE
jgi:pyruvate dehydrogenase E1 component alpha subunit